jgi:CRP-like cAMP-binding protein
MPVPVAPTELRDVPLLADLPEWALDSLAARAEIRRLEAGAPIVAQHAEADAVFVLLEGSAEILLRFEGVGDLLVGVVRKRGGVIGWSALREPHRYTGSVRSEEPSVLLRLPREAFDEVFARDGRVGARILRRVAGTVDERLQAALGLLHAPSATTPVEPPS